LVWVVSRIETDTPPSATLIGKLSVFIRLSRAFSI
jgi:hypothetical protein